MSAIVNIDDGKGNGDYRVLCKGAPEIIKYLETFLKVMRKVSVICKKGSKSVGNIL